MSMFPHTITIFNQSSKTVQPEPGSTAPAEVIEPYFRRTVINGVLFVRDESTSRNRYGLQNADKVTVYIPKKTVDKINKTLVDGVVYEGENETQQAASYSFKKGDYLYFGEYPSDCENINAIKNQSGSIYQITGVDEYLFGSLPIYVIGAK